MAKPSGAVLLGGRRRRRQDPPAGRAARPVRRRRLALLVGHCLDFGDSALPYLPFSEAFGRLAIESPALASSLVDAAPAIARLMPQRRMLSGPDPIAVPDGPAVDVDASALMGAGRMDRSELFEAVHSALETLGQSKPLLILLEDAHWADQSTRELLSFLFSRRFSEPVAIVTSYRSDDLHRRHPLRTTVAEWGRLPGVTRLQLRPLDDADVRELVRVLHPAPLPESELRRIVERSEGNAFFTEELVAAAELGSRLLPTDLADLLLVRLDQLDDATRLVVRAAAVAGRRVPHELLAASSTSTSSGSNEPCAPRSRATCSCRSAPTAMRSGMPCSPRRSTTTCCPANACGCTVPTSLRCSRVTFPALPPSWPAMPGPLTMRPPRLGQASRPETRR